MHVDALESMELVYPPKVITWAYFRWARSVDPLLYLNPVWWQAIEWVNLCVLTPFAMIASIAFLRGWSWVRIPAVSVVSYAERPFSVHFFTCEDRHFVIHPLLPHHLYRSHPVSLPVGVLRLANHSGSTRSAGTATPRQINRASSSAFTSCTSSFLLLLLCGSGRTNPLRAPSRAPWRSCYLLSAVAHSQSLLPTSLSGLCCMPLPHCLLLSSNLWRSLLARCPDAKLGARASMLCCAGAL